jgi:hypothetical protein
VVEEMNEAKRKNIFKEIAEAEIMADNDAQMLYPLPVGDWDDIEEEYNKQSYKLQHASYDLDMKYKSDVAEKYGLTRDQMIEISVEGVAKFWPGCKEPSSNKDLDSKAAQLEIRLQDWEVFQNGRPEDEVEIVGVYSLEDKSGAPCSLVELIIRNCLQPLDFSEFRQEKPSVDPSGGYQVPYLEHMLDFSGENILADDYGIGKHPELWDGDVRIVFFLHFLDPYMPLKTPFGFLRLPLPIKMPDRLKKVKYENPY